MILFGNGPDRRAKRHRAITVDKITRTKIKMSKQPQPPKSNGKTPFFKPPWWLRGGHAQTIIGSQWPQRLPKEKAVIRTVDLGDGDAVAVHDDTPKSWQPSGKVIVMAHGVSDDHRSPFLVRLKTKLYERGVRVFRWDMRGCGAGKPLARRPYHAGCSGDLAKVVDAVIAWTGGPASVPPDLSLFGVSLGGNVLLKYLGEEPNRVPAAVRHAIAVNPPIDLVMGVKAIGTGTSRIYDRHLTRRLVARLEEWWQERPDAIRAAEGRRPRSLLEFDNWFTASAVGFRDALDYYQKSSASQFIPAISTPTTIIASRDDPLVPFAMFDDKRVSYPSCVRLVATDQGGHVGFIGRVDGDPDSRWLDWRVIEMVSPQG